jgi:hypothetical protein
MERTAGGKRIIDLVSDRIIALTSWRMILAVLAGFLVTAFLVNGRPFGIARLKEMTGGVGILDMEILYTPQQAYSLLSAMGEAGREFDLTHIVPLDFLVPLFYSLTFSLLITWLLHRWLPEGSTWHRLNVIPLAGGFCDYLENLGVIAMLLAWPAQIPDIARFTMVFGLFKFMFSALAFAIIVGAITGWIIHGIRIRCGRSHAL